MMKFLVLLFLLGAAVAFPRPNIPYGAGEFGERIIGGEQAARGQFPYQIQIQYFGGHQCGAAIINAHWIVTAGHCLSGLAVSYVIVANQYDILVQEGLERRQSGQRWIRHPQYNPDTLTNDIAILRVSNPLYTDETDPVVRPIALPRHGHQAAVGRLATVSGWGVTSEGGLLPRYLRYVDVPIVDDVECAKSYGGTPQWHPDQMICAGHDFGGKDACNGDSGGPLVCQDSEDGEEYLCGIVSWGNGCARPRYYGVYTEIGAYVNWILNNID